MMMPKTTVWRAIGVIVAAELLVLGAMVWDRVSLLANGREVVLDVVPVDPRSLFRGDYVILNYEISRIDGAKVEDTPGRGDVLYVTLAKDAAGKWQVARASGLRAAAATPDEVVLKARPRHGNRFHASSRSPVSVRYGIESFFVPEETGKALEKLVGEKRIRVRVAVGSDGTAALKGLEVDGRLVHREPLI